MTFPCSATFVTAEKEKQIELIVVRSILPDCDRRFGLKLVVERFFLLIRCDIEAIQSINQFTHSLQSKPSQFSCSHNNSHDKRKERLFFPSIKQSKTKPQEEKRKNSFSISITYNSLVEMQYPMCCDFSMQVPLSCLSLIVF